MAFAALHIRIFMMIVNSCCVLLLLQPLVVHVEQATAQID